MNYLNAGPFSTTKASHHHFRELLVALRASGRLRIVACSGAINFAVFGLDQIRPDLRQRFLGEHLLTCYQAARSVLNWQAKRYWHWPIARSPSANIGSVRADGLAQRSEPAAAARKVSFEVHALQYSDSLKQCNSESHIYIFSDLLCNPCL